MNVPECDAWTLQQHSVVSRDLLVEVRQQRDVNVAQTPSLTEHNDIIGVLITFDNYLFDYLRSDPECNSWTIKGTIPSVAC